MFASFLVRRSGLIRTAAAVFIAVFGAVVGLGQVDVPVAPQAEDPAELELPDGLPNHFDVDIEGDLGDMMSDAADWSEDLAGTASFGPRYVPGLVPDWNQPYAYTATSLNRGPGPAPAGGGRWSAWCSPTSASNLAGHWNDVYRLAVADGVPFPLSRVMWARGASWQDFLADGGPFVRPPPIPGLATDIGYYMDTNRRGANLGNGPHIGTYLKDIDVGLRSFLGIVDPTGTWRVATCGRGYAAGTMSNGAPATVHPFLSSAFAQIKSEIDHGRTVIVTWDNWNLVYTGVQLLPAPGVPTTSEAGFGVYFCTLKPGTSDPWGNYEIWDDNPTGLGLGHTVTVVGYMLQSDPKNPFRLTHPSWQWVIVHDNIKQTARNIAVPFDLRPNQWGYWKANTTVARVP